MAINTKANNDTNAQSISQIANQSFDQTYQVNVVEPLVFNPTTSALDRLVQPTGDSKYSTNHLDDYTTANVTYIGQEDTSGVWKMIKIDETGNFPVYTYASVTNNPTLTTYTLAWAGRVSAVYQVYSLAF